MIKLHYSSRIFFLLLINYCAVAQEEVNPYKKLTKQFIGAVKKNEPWRNYRFFDSSSYGRSSESDATRKIEDFNKNRGPIVAVEKTVVDTQGCKMATCTSIKGKNGKFLWYHYYDQAEYLQRFEVDTFHTQWFYKPEPLENTNFTRKEIAIVPNHFIRLPGYLYVPTGNKKSALVIFVHDSGQNDRNGSMSKNKVYLDMALALVQKGISVLIYDKRTYVYSFNDPFPADSMDYYSETIDDAVEAFSMSKKIKEIDSSRIYIAGHSLGGMCAPLIAKKCNGLKGLILLAPIGRSLLESIPDQLDYVLSLQTTNKEDSQKMIDYLKWQIQNALKPGLNLKSKLVLPGNGKPKYWMTDQKYKVLDEAKTLTLPIILLQGGRDYNVTKKDFDLWTGAMQGKSNFKAHWIENVDHYFFEGQGKARPEDIYIPKHVSKNVTNKIIEFVNGK